MSDQLTLFAADSPVSLGAPPGSKAALKMTATSGRRCCELSRISGLGGSLARMSEALFQTPWASTAVYLTWKAKATPAGRLLFQLAPSAPRTEGTGAGFWPSPATRDHHAQGANHNTKAKSSSLATMIQKKGGWLWPTPHGFSPDGKTNGPSGNELGRAVNQSLWPTPTAASHQNPGDHGQGGQNLVTEVCRQPDGTTPTTGSLNPEWVEWLMNFPPGWTNLETLPE